MTREQLWAIYATKNPQFDGDGNITLSVKGIRKLFDQTYEAGRTAGVIQGRALEQMKPKTETVSDIFGGMFGREKQ